jgi:hypothetical protein
MAEIYVPPLVDEPDEKREKGLHEFRARITAEVL